MDGLRDLIEPYPGFLPGLVLSLVVAAVACGWLARTAGIGRTHAFVLLMSLGVVASATLMPGPDAFGGTVGESGGTTAWGLACDLGRIRPPSLTELGSYPEALANVVLFVPLGVIIGLLPGAKRAPVAVAALVLPFLIELGQAVVPQLGRACQSSDVVDNLVGLLVGLAIGFGISAVASAVVRRRT